MEKFKEETKLPLKLEIEGPGGEAIVEEELPCS